MIEAMAAMDVQVQEWLQHPRSETNKPDPGPGNGGGGGGGSDTKYYDPARNAHLVR